MMGEDQVAGAAMHIILRSKMFFGNCRVFYVPARAAITKRTVPAGLFWFGKSPQDKVALIFFLGAFVYAAGGVFSGFRGAAGQFAIIGEFVQVKIVSFVFDEVGDSFFDKHLH